MRRLQHVRTPPLQAANLPALLHRRCFSASPDLHVRAGSPVDEQAGRWQCGKQSIQSARNGIASRLCVSPTAVWFSPSRELGDIAPEVGSAQGSTGQTPCLSDVFPLQLCEDAWKAVRIGCSVQPASLPPPPWEKSLPPPVRADRARFLGVSASASISLMVRAPLLPKT